MKAYTFMEFSDKLHSLFPNSKFQLLSWNGIKHSCSFHCDDCNKDFTYAQADKIIDRFRRGLQLICNNCEDTSQYTPRQKLLQKVKYVLQKKQTIVQLKEVKDMRALVSWKCIKCNHVFERNIKDFLTNSKCPWCEGMFPKYTIDIIKEKMRNIWGEEYTVLSENYNYQKSVKIKVRHCCGFIFDSNVHNLIRGHGCPKCKSSSGERIVSNFLDEHNICYLTQYHFINTDISNLSFDFYIDNGKEIFVIEYNGRQHYEPVDFFGGEQSFLAQKERDFKKQKFCQEKNITLIIIPYYNHLILSQELAQRLKGEGT